MGAGGAQKGVPKRTQKRVILGVPGTPNVAFELGFIEKSMFSGGLGPRGVPQNDPFLGHFGVPLWIRGPDILVRLLGDLGQKGPKMGPKKGSKKGQKRVILGPPGGPKGPRSGTPFYVENTIDSHWNVQKRGPQNDPILGSPGVRGPQNDPFWVPLGTPY